MKKGILLVTVFLCTFQAQAASWFQEIFGEKKFSQKILSVIEVPGEQGPATDNFFGAWLDKNTLILNNIVPSEGGKRKWKKKIVVWNQSRKELQTLMDDAHLLCVNELTGHVKIQSNSDIKLYEISIPGLELKEIPQLGWEKNQCMEYFPLPMDKLSYGLDYHRAYIEYGVMSASGAYRGNAFFVNENGGRKEIDMPASYVKQPTYDRYANKYWLTRTSLSSNSAEKKVSMLYLIDNNGVLEKIKLPDYYMKDIGVTYGAAATRKGFLINGAGARMNGVLFSGLFLLNEKELTRIYNNDKNIDVLKVSPDGCSVAFVESSNYWITARETVKIINICDGDLK
ncbi:hypothetical protein V8J88_15560 [Massilia sp. W12]|uniref:hypothetical protein n=1 Tax=Massilia sp. W12 TaxID=3126507 RepID=UPI0030D350F5